MKKIFTTVFCVFGLLAAAHAEWHITANEYDILSDTTIIVTDYELDDLAGEIVMTVEGALFSDESEDITVDVTRSEAGISDQVCAGTCINGNGETTQRFEFDIENPLTGWYAHYYPATEGEVTITYAFSDGVNPTRTLTVRYLYQATALDNTIAAPVAKGVYTLDGQYVADDTENLPQGVYIVDGKKQIVH